LKDQEQITYGTELANGGIGLPALMSLMGHVTPEMTLRYAKLASPTIRDAYQNALDKIRTGPMASLLITSDIAPAVTDRVQWLHSEMLKTRLAHGFCTRSQAAGPCAYANICEQCDNFVPDPAADATIAAQLADIHILQADAQARGWHDETARHTRTTTDLQRHLDQLRREQKPATTP
jgi:hypothetical protein